MKKKIMKIGGNIYENFITLYSDMYNYNNLLSLRALFIRVWSIERIRKEIAKMNCIECGNRATPVVKFESATSYICEFCGESFSVCRSGKASQKELDSLKLDQFSQVVNTGAYKPYRMIIGEKLQQNSDIKLTNPNWRNVETGTLRARGVSSK